jgi:hypothetical protein
MAYSRKPITISSGDTLNEWRDELNATIERLNEMFNSSDELQPKSGAKILSPEITTPIVTGGTFSDSIITSATVNDPIVSNPTITGGSSNGSTITNAVINDATFNNLGTASARDIGTGVSDVPVYSDLEAATDSEAPSNNGAFLGQLYYDSNDEDWYIWNGTSWDQISIV